MQNYPAAPAYPSYPPTNNNNDPFHQRYLGYNVYDQYYPENYNGYRGFGRFPFTFWLFLLGIFIPPVWLLALCCFGSHNPYERMWARACLGGLCCYIILAVIFGLLGGLYWSPGYYNYGY